jgi:hypothetical protein
MIYNFRTESDGQQWVVDTEALSWAKASSIIASPTIKAAETNIARFVPAEEGQLIPLGAGRFALNGRKPFDAENKPQLAIFIVLTLLTADNEGTCVTLFQANVPIKEVQHQHIKNFHIQCLPPLKITPREAIQPPAAIVPVAE